MSRPKKGTSGKCSWTPSRNTSSMPAGSWTVVTWPRRTPTKATSSWKTLTSWQFWKWEESRQERGRYLLNSWISQDSGYGINAVLGIFANTPRIYRIEVASARDNGRRHRQFPQQEGSEVVFQPDATELYHKAVGVGRRRPDERVQGQGDRRGGGKRVPAGKVSGPRPAGQRRRR